ncbi:MAG: hypothetical protein RL115_2150 [Bacteroidota bacterium]|jgi:hypothetical protein
MSVTYHIRIKKEYANAVIEDLQKMEAVELLIEADTQEVPDWQMKLGKQELENIAIGKTELLNWAATKERLKR